MIIKVSSKTDEEYKMLLKMLNIICTICAKRKGGFKKNSISTQTIHLNTLLIICISEQLDFLLCHIVTIIYEDVEQYSDPLYYPNLLMKMVKKTRVFRRKFFCRCFKTCFERSTLRKAEHRTFEMLLFS